MITLIIIVLLFILLRNRIFAYNPQWKNQKVLFALGVPLVNVCVLLLLTNLSFENSAMIAKIDSLRYGSTWANHFGGYLSEVFSFGMDLGVIQDEMSEKGQDLIDLESFANAFKMIATISLVAVFGMMAWYYKGVFTHHLRNHSIIMWGAACLTILVLFIAATAIDRLASFCALPGQYNNTPTIVTFSIILAIAEVFLTYKAITQYKELSSISAIESDALLEADEPKTQTQDSATANKAQSIDDSGMERLYKLKEMLDNGLISEEEYQKLKSEILNK